MREGTSDSALEPALKTRRLELDAASSGCRVTAEGQTALENAVGARPGVPTNEAFFGRQSECASYLTAALRIAAAMVALAIAAQIGTWQSDPVFFMILLVLLLPLEGLSWRLEGVPEVDKKAQAAAPMTIVEAGGDETAAALQARCAASAPRDGPGFAVDEATCRRFLRASQGNADKAAAALRKYTTWREEVRPGDITLEEVQRELAIGKSYVHGFDRIGQPILWASAGRHCRATRDLDECIKMILYNLEVAIRKAESQGLEQMCVVFDLSGFGTKSIDYEVTKFMIAVLGSYYPGRLGSVLLWNAPSIFSMFWNVVRCRIDPITFQKFKFVRGGDLTSFVETAQMPAEIAETL